MAVEIRDDSQSLESSPISKLRQIAAAEGVPITRDMKAEMILHLIKESRNSSIPKARLAISDRPDPGWARIEIHRDPDPKAANSDVFAAVNGYQVLIQRGVKVDVPIKILRGSLQLAKNQVLREDTNKKFSDEGRYFLEEVYAYPFTVHDIHEGPDPRPGTEAAAARKNAPRKQFHKEKGYWPRHQELRDWLRAKTGGN